MNYGLLRPDAALKFEGRNNALASGFEAKIKTPRGWSTFVLEAKTDQSSWRSLFTRRIKGPLFSRRQPEGFELWFDQPKDWDELGANLRISGWCVAMHGRSIVAVRARVGRRVIPVNYGLLRPDTALKFESRNNSLASGFEAKTKTPRGWSTFVFEAKTDQSSWQRLFTRRIKGPLFSRRRFFDEAVGDYTEWIRKYDTLIRGEREKIQQHITRFERTPLFSILLPVYNTDPRWLRLAINSVRNQLYPRWELCIVDDASSDSSLWKLIQGASQSDSRIKISRRSERGHICVASNDTLAMATGEFIVLLDHDDEIAPTALYFAALELNRRPEVQLLYTDEDKLDERGRRCQPHFKSDWNPDLFTAQNYISHLGIYNTALVREVGGFRVGFEGAQDHDLALRCIEKLDPTQIVHLPRILYHWRMVEQSTAAATLVKPYALQAAARAVLEHFDRTKVSVTVEQDRQIYLRVRRPIATPPPLVSMIIPTRDRVELLQQLVTSIFAKTDYPNYEIIIVDNESSEPATLDFFQELKKDGRVTTYRVPGPFNYSKLNNIGVSKARGSVIALMNNDLQVINGDWLQEMVSHAIRAEVGAVGARLWYPNQILQHGGVILGFGGVAGHIHGTKRDDAGYFSRQHLTQNFSAVTAACMLVRKEVYQEMNGFDETNLPVAFDDVDFCLRLGRAGYRIVWTPYAEFFHHESASRGIEDTAEKQRRFLSEIQYMQGEWGDLLLGDPFYNPSLSLDSKLFTLAFPPRLTKPWEGEQPHS